MIEMREIDTETEMTSALDEKLKEAIIGELKRQAADKPQALSVRDSPDLFVNGKIDLDALIMVIAGSIAGGP
jgi:sugar-specific transcriptional regulator TrmB